MRTAVILLNYNSENETLECIQTINRSDFTGQVIVVDNSEEKSKKLKSTLSQYKNITLLEPEHNLGFTGGNNLGVKHALKNDAEIIVILNNDTIVEKDTISKLAKIADEKNALVSPKIYFAKGHEYHKSKYKKSDLGNVIWYAGGKVDWDNVVASHIGVDEVDKGQHEIEKEVDFATGACFAIPAKIIKKVGMFDDKYFLYYEDSDLSQRAKKSGFKVLYYPGVSLAHKNAQSTGGSGSSLQDYYITRNRILFALKHASFRSKIAVLKESIKLLINGRPLQKKGVKDFYKLSFGKMK